MFTKSYLQFTDSLGILVTLIANLESQSQGDKDQEGYDQSEYEQVYQGNLINPVTLPNTLEVGVIGTGSINGVSGRVKLLNVFGSSLDIAQTSFGQKIRVALIQQTQFLNSGELS